jgi:protein subunit release factor B
MGRKKERLAKIGPFLLLDGPFIWYHGQRGMEGAEPKIVLSLEGRAVVVLFAVSEEKNRWLQERMEALDIREKDIEEKFVRSSGSGGQKVNKASTCVYLRHIPTGIEIKCMRERSQSLNRFLARRELVRRFEKGLGRLTPENIMVDKARRKKSKRKKRARLKYGKE